MNGTYLIIAGRIRSELGDLTVITCNARADFIRIIGLC